jgi:taurine--2-oxoglutarate transaminase
VLIIDETMTGLGRTGKMFAIEHYGIEPDIMVLGKALGVYCPLGATIFNPKIARAFDDNVFAHGQSFSGHALACAAGLASLQVIWDEGLLDRATELGSYLGERLDALRPKHPCVGDVRGLGLFWTVELVKDRQTKEPFRKQGQKYAHTVITEIARFLLEEKNIYLPGDKFGLWIVPPLVVTRDEIDLVVEAIDEALDIADRQATR